MTAGLDNSAILEELKKDEEELHKDEKRATLAFVLGMCFVLFLIAGASYFIIKSIAANKSTQTLVKEITVSITVTPTLAPSALTTPAPVINQTTNVSTTHDYYINLGYGSNQSTDWTDVAGATTTADIGQYQNIKDVSFEAFINVPTANGTVSVRLFNETDKHPVWNSELTRDGTSSTYQFISPPVSYDIGPKLYQVQMKSQFSNVLANLVSARIHIVTK